MDDRSWVAGAVNFWRPKARGAPVPRPADGFPGDGDPPAPARVAPLRSRGSYLLASSWLYAVVAVAALFLIRLVGDAWWPVTLLLFMPRWLFLGPVAVLAVASGLRRRFGHWAVQGATAAVIAGPLMGASLAVHQLYQSPPAGDVVRVATCNLGLERFRGDDLLRWIDREKIDVVCFQEGWIDYVALRMALPDGWRLSRNGSIATRLEVVADVDELSPQLDDDGKPYTSRLERWRLRAPSGSVFEVASIHLPTMRFGIEQFLAHGDPAGIKYHKRKWDREMIRILSSLRRRGDVPLMVGGDFNMPPDATTMSAVRADFRDAFEEGGWGYGYTKPARWPWARIDHILASPEWSIAGCSVGPDFGSDHLPLVAEAVLPRPPRRMGERPSARPGASGIRQGLAGTSLHGSGAE